MSANRIDVPHYTSGGIEVIDILKAKLTRAEYRGFLRGNVVKYILRYDHKGTPGADLRKAQTYLGWLINEMEEEAK